MIANTIIWFRSEFAVFSWCTPYPFETLHFKNVQFDQMKGAVRFKRRELSLAWSCWWTAVSLLPAPEESALNIIRPRTAKPWEINGASLSLCINHCCVCSRWSPPRFVWFVSLLKRNQLLVVCSFDWCSDADVFFNCFRCYLSSCRHKSISSSSPVIWISITCRGDKYCPLHVYIFCSETYLTSVDFFSHHNPQTCCWLKVIFYVNWSECAAALFALLSDWCLQAVTALSGETCHHMASDLHRFDLLIPF